MLFASLASCTDVRYPAMVNVDPVHFPGVSATGTWMSYGRGAPYVGDVILRLTEASDGTISGTWYGGFSPCGCQLWGDILPASSRRNGVMLTLHATVEGYPIAEQMTFEAEMLAAQHLRGMMDVFSNTRYDEAGNTLDFSR
ncbi:MAG: hypothetical protein JWO05_3586 [Gemmatimonadetes bacterium]|nr:hypothetical protein [Gemmatimonadota bacterium]